MDTLDDIKKYLEVNGFKMRKVNGGYVQSSDKGDGIKFVIHINNSFRCLKLWKKKTFNFEWYDKRKNELKKIIPNLFIEKKDPKSFIYKNEESGRWCYRILLDNVSKNYILEIVKNASKYLIN